MSRHTELSEHSVREHLIWLETHGFIIRTERRWTDSKKRRTDLYELQISYEPGPETYRKISPVGGNIPPANSAGYESSDKNCKSSF